MSAATATLDRPITDRVRSAVGASSRVANISGPSPVTKSILQALADGDPKAAEAFLDQYGDLLWSLARRFCDDHAEIEDCVQDAVIEIWRSASKFDATKASETTFVAMIARRRYIDRLRQRKRRPAPEPLAEDDQLVGDQGGPSLETLAEVEQIKPLIAEMRDVQRNVVQLAIFRGYSHGDIARVLNMPLGTVKTHLRRAMLSIRERLGEQDHSTGEAL
ncbi:MAG: RNA polymerase sigma factor [Pseudomonadota bacterium]